MTARSRDRGSGIIAPCGVFTPIPRTVLVGNQTKPAISSLYKISLIVDEIVVKIQKIVHKIVQKLVYRDKSSMNSQKKSFIAIKTVI